MPTLAQPRQLAKAGRHHHQHPIGLQTAQGEQQCPRRGPIGPLQIVDHHQHHLLAAADLTQPHHQIGAHRQRVDPIAQQLRGRQQPQRAAPRSPGSGHQLTHDAIRQQQLRLVTTGAQHRRRGHRCEPRQQSRPADPRFTLDEHDLGLPVACQRRTRLQLARPAYEHPPASSGGSRRQPVQGKSQRSPPSTGTAISGHLSVPVRPPSTERPPATPDTSQRTPIYATRFGRADFRCRNCPPVARARRCTTPPVGNIDTARPGDNPLVVGGVQRPTPQPRSVRLHHRRRQRAACPFRAYLVFPRISG